VLWHGRKHVLQQVQSKIHVMDIVCNTVSINWTIHSFITTLYGYCLHQSISQLKNTQFQNKLLWIMFTLQF
jgi:hypothetical protein